MQKDYSSITQKKNPFSAILDIQKYELKKIIPLCLMIILATYVANVLRATKDALVIPLMGAEVISTLKLYAVVPSAILFIMLYSKLLNSLSREKVYNVVVSIFICFFLFFGFFLYPNHEYLHSDLTDLALRYPSMKWPILVVSKWSFSLFYVVADMCGNIMIYVLFFRLANQINTVDEAKKYYAFFIMIGHIGHMFSGITVSKVSQYYIAGGNSQEHWQNALNTLIFAVTIAFICKILIHKYIWAKVVPDEKLVAPNIEEKNALKNSKKAKISIFQSLKLVFTSKYIGLVASMILCYGVSINIVESVWKSQVRLSYATSNEYNGFMGLLQTYGAIFYIIVAAVAMFIIKRFSWLSCAMILPFIVLVTGFMFFSLTIFEDHFAPILAYYSITAGFLAVQIGAIQNVFSKSVKYSIFDTVKEMSYIPLSDNLKSQGKAASDLLGHKIGKSGGAFIQWLLLSIMPHSNLLDLAPYLFIIFAFMICLWIYSVICLNREFSKMNT